MNEELLLTGWDLPPLSSQAHSKLATCQTCKTLIKTGEVLHGLGVGGVMGSFCSVNCLNKGKLTTASFVGKEPGDATLRYAAFFFCVVNSSPALYVPPILRFHSSFPVCDGSVEPGQKQQAAGNQQNDIQSDLNQFLSGCVVFFGHFFPVCPVYC